MKKRRFSGIPKYIFEVGLAVIFLALGFFLGIGFNYKKDFSIQFDNKIVPTDLLSVFVGVILVWVVTNSLDKEKTAKRASIDIIQKRVHELYLFIDEFSKKNFTDNYLYTDATSSLKTMLTGISAIGGLLDAAKLNINSAITDHVKEKQDILDKLLTNSEIRDEADTSERDLRVTNNVCYFSNNHLNKIQKQCNALKDALLKLEIDINVS